MFRLDNKVVVITGGGSGIGKAISTTFAKQGAIVYILEMDEKNAASTVEEITTEGGKGSFFKCNIANQQEVKTVVAQIIQKHDAIDFVQLRQIPYFVEQTPLKQFQWPYSTGIP